MKNNVKKIIVGFLSLSMILTSIPLDTSKSIVSSITSVQVSAAASKLPAPLGVNANADINSITLSWKSVSGSCAYNIYEYNFNTKDYEKIQTVEDTSYIVTDLKSDTEYKFRISSLSEENGKYIEGNKSVAVTATTLPGLESTTYLEENIEYFALPYLYDELTDDGKEAYIKLRKDFLSHKYIVKIKMKYPDCKDYSNFFKIKAAVSLDPLLMGYLDDYYKIKNRTAYYIVRYNVSTKEQYKMTNEALKEAKKIADKVKTYTLYNKILYIYDYIASNCVYDDSNDITHTAYACLVNKKACCEGMTDAFSVICTYAGIEVIEIMGDDLDIYDYSTHIWNKVKYIGKWYNIDVTWDNSAESENESVQKVFDNKTYYYFMISDNTIKKDHIIDDLDGYANYPIADDDSKNYYTVKGLCVTNMSNIDDFIYNQLVKAAENGEKGICFNVPDNELCEKIWSYLLNNDGENTLKLTKRLSNNIKSNKQVIERPGYLDRNMNTIYIYIFYKDTPLTDYFTDEEIATFSKKFLNAFKRQGIE